MAGEDPQLRGLAPPASIANSAVTGHTEGDAWMVAQGSLCNIIEGGAPRVGGNPHGCSSRMSGQCVPASSGVAQSIGQHAGVGNPAYSLHIASTASIYSELQALRQQAVQREVLRLQQEVYRKCNA